MSDFNDFEEDDFSLDELEYETFSAEQLVGRNFYHYTNGLQDPVQPESYALSELELSEDEKFEVVTQRILKEHKAAFEELAK